MNARISPEPPEKLSRDHATDGFDSGAGELDDWLIRFAYQNQRAHDATTYVACIGSRVIGYYAVAMAAVERDTTPARLRAGRPRQLPCVLLARLAVDRNLQGHGVGAGLLRDALQRSVLLSETIGAAAVLVHARDEDASAFYLANGDFLRSPLDPLQLMAPMQELRHIFGGGNT